MKEFHYSIDDLMKLDLKRFWFLVSQVDRLRAESDIRTLQLLGSVTDGETYQQAIDGLKDELGQIYIWKEAARSVEIRIDPETGFDVEFDRAGFEALKRLNSAPK